MATQLKMIMTVVQFDQEDEESDYSITQRTDEHIDLDYDTIITVDREAQSNAIAKGLFPIIAHCLDKLEIPQVDKEESPGILIPDTTIKTRRKN